MRMDKEINNNGYDYVDLGLPSGTIWATCNVGADKPSDWGFYFQWGDTVGYTKEQIGTDNMFTWNDYKCNPSGDAETFTKYTTSGTALYLEDDAANANMGRDWHMPSPEQISELINNTTSEWTTLDGVSGMTFASKKDKSKFIFIPAAGYAWDGAVNDSEIYGKIWSSMLSANSDSYGLSFNFLSDNINLYNDCRDDGHSIRGVIG